VTARQRSTHKGILGSAVVGKHITDFLDLNSVLSTVTGNWSQASPSSSSSVLLIDADPFSREIVKTCLEMDDYDVVEAVSCDEASQLLETRSIALLVLRPASCSDHALAVLQALMNRTAGGIPMLALADSPTQLQSPVAGASVHRWVPKYDTQEILRAAAELSGRTSAAQCEPELLLETV
jgi:response regulator RpfG family c-di-GMP phosphodiesterase